jgi:hypothetical protein
MCKFPFLSLLWRARQRSAKFDSSEYVLKNYQGNCFFKRVFRASTRLLSYSYRMGFYIHSIYINSMSFGDFWDFYVWIYSFDISLLLLGIFVNFLPSFWRHWVVAEDNVKFLGYIVFILLNAILYGIFYKLMNSNLIKDLIPE